MLPNLASGKDFAIYIIRLYIAMMKLCMLSVSFFICDIVELYQDWEVILPSPIPAKMQKIILNYYITKKI